MSIFFIHKTHESPRQMIIQNRKSIICMCLFKVQMKWQRFVMWKVKEFVYLVERISKAYPSLVLNLHSNAKQGSEHIKAPLKEGRTEHFGFYGNRCHLPLTILFLDKIYQHQIWKQNRRGDKTCDPRPQTQPLCRGFTINKDRIPRAGTSIPTSNYICILR